jgi:GntR family transcriptional regulator
MNEEQPNMPSTLSRQPLSATEPIPLYYQIKQQLKRSIEAGELPPGAALPSERELCERYGVSRPTVRQATQDLINEGLLERRRGIGTYVAQPRIQHRLGSVLGFSERMLRDGRQPSTQLIERAVISGAAVGADVTGALQIAATAAVLRLVRLRFADGEPVLLETVHLPLGRFAGLDQVDLAHESLYGTLRERYGCEIRTLRETLEPVLLGESDAELLDTEAGRPAMLTHITTYDQTGQAVEHTFSLVRGDRCQYYIEFNVGEDKTSGSAHLRQTQLEVSF